MAVRPHAFVAMPFGRKPGPDGTEVDFNRVYDELIAPAIEAAGLTAFRADQEQSGGSILADLVVADLSIPNPNVWYEVGVRHALRARGVVLLFGGKAPPAFDLYTERKLRYGLAGGGPDPATLKDDRKALEAMIKATMAAWYKERISPVYYHVTNLLEPDWKTLRVGKVERFWQQHEDWERRVALAGEEGRIGDVLVLADEGPVAAFRAEARLRAGIELRQLREYTLALECFDKVLALDPGNLAAGRETGICLQRLALAGVPGHSLARARQHYQALLQEHPRDVETWALLGRIDKDAWVATWRRKGSDAAAMRADAAYEDALLKDAIASYERAYRADPGHYFSGINALTLLHLGAHLGLTLGEQRDRDMIAGAVRFAAENEDDDKKRYWAAVTLGDLAVLVGTPTEVTQAYKAAVALPRVDWFSLSSCRDQLLLLQDLGFRAETVSAGLAVFDRVLARLQKPEAAWQPRQVILFSGHMVDSPTRAPPRFPARAEPIAAQAIAAELDRLGAGPQDLALCQAAAGGDLLFLEACQARGVKCRVQLPFAEPEFVERSVLPSADGPRWRDRFYAALAKPDTTLSIMPVALGPAPDGVDPFERCNLWLLYTALAAGLQKVRFITLWNGGGGDGPGGTGHMVGEVKRLTGHVTWLDTRELFKSLLPPQA